MFQKSRESGKHIDRSNEDGQDGQEKEASTFYQILPRVPPPTVSLFHHPVVTIAR